MNLVNRAGEPHLFLIIIIIVIFFLNKLPEVINHLIVH